VCLCSNQVLFGPLYRTGLGLEDGEFTERINAFVSPWGFIVRRMCPGSEWPTLVTGPLTFWQAGSSYPGLGQLCDHVTQVNMLQVHIHFIAAGTQHYSGCHSVLIVACTQAALIA
jgi:hypothetical protein